MGCLERGLNLQVTRMTKIMYDSILIAKIEEIDRWVTLKKQFKSLLF